MKVSLMKFFVFCDILLLWRVEKLMENSTSQWTFIESARNFRQKTFSHPQRVLIRLSVRSRITSNICANFSMREKVFLHFSARQESRDENARNENENQLIEKMYHFTSTKPTTLILNFQNIAFVSDERRAGENKRSRIEKFSVLFDLRSSVGLRCCDKCRITVYLLYSCGRMVMRI